MTTFRLSMLAAVYAALCGCSVAPLVIIPTSNVVTHEIHENRYEAYNNRYSDRVSFGEVSIPRGEHKLYGRTFGPWNATDKPVIILMHGFPDSLHLYDELAPQLADDYRVISFDFLGWGRSDKPKKHRYDSSSQLSDLEAVIAFVGADRVTLVVHDASGPAGIQWALDHPDRVEQLVLLNTFFHPMPGLVKPEAIDLFSTPGLRRAVVKTAGRISSVGFHVVYKRQLNRFFLDRERARELVPVFAYQALRIRPAFTQLTAALDAEVAARASEVSRMEAYAGSVLIVFGASDPYLNLSVAQDFHSRFPNSQLTLIEDAGHFVQVDQPEAVVAAIRDGQAARYE